MNVINNWNVWFSPEEEQKRREAYEALYKSKDWLKEHTPDEAMPYEGTRSFVSHAAAQKSYYKCMFPFWDTEIDWYHECEHRGAACP